MDVYETLGRAFRPPKLVDIGSDPITLARAMAEVDGPVVECSPFDAEYTIALRSHRHGRSERKTYYFREVPK